MIKRKTIKIIVPLVITLFCPVYNVLALTEPDITESADSVVTLWKTKSDYYDFVHLDKSVFPINIWTINRFFPQKNTFSYDVKKTDSLVSPYVLEIHFKAKSFSNLESPRADLKLSGHIVGFTTKEKAATSISDSDFNDVRGPINPALSPLLIREVVLYYAFQKGNWVFKNADHNRKGELTELLQSEATNDLFIIPVRE
jgi:hypothetical protein